MNTDETTDERQSLKKHFSSVYVQGPQFFSFLQYQLPRNSYCPALTHEPFPLGCDSPTDRHQEKWAELWDNGDFISWDKGFPSPALVDLLAQRQQHTSFTAQDLVARGERRKRALVPVSTLNLTLMRRIWEEGGGGVSCCGGDRRVFLALV